VIGGVWLQSQRWREALATVQGIKTTYRIRTDVELKWKNLVRRTGAADHLTEARVASFLADLGSQLTGIVAAVCVIVDKRAAVGMGLDYLKTDEHIYHTGLRYCLQRLAFSLRETPEPDGAIVIADSRGDTKDNRIRRYFEDLIYGNVRFAATDLTEVVEGLFFQKSHYSLGIQLADFIVGAVFQKYEKELGAGLAALEPWLRRSPRGTIAGWGLIEVPSPGQKAKTTASGSRP
jgi:hypothetical protein